MENIFLTIFKISLTTSIVVLALIVLGSLINKRYAAKWKYRLWIILALRLLIPINYELPDAQLQITIPAEMGSQKVSEIFESEPLAATVYSEPLVMDPPAPWSQTMAPLTVEPDIREKSQPSVTLLQALSYLWAVGVICLLLWQLTSFFYYKGKLIKNGKTIKNPILLEELNELCEKLGIRSSITFLTYSKAQSPMVLGFFHPVLVLPKEEYSREESYYILKHELVHLRRHDILVKFLLLLARDFHWFNPAIYLMQREAVVDMEIACDEAVVRGESFDQRKAYTETLLSNLHRQRSRGPLLSTQFSGGVRIMKKRFKNILTKANKKSGTILFAIIAVLTITVGAMVSYAKEDPTPEMTSDGTFSGNATEEETPGQSAGEGDISTPGIEETDDLTADSSLAAGAGREATTTLTLLKEGMEEEASATLYVGEGYSFYLIDGIWAMLTPDSWYGEKNERVRFWISNYAGLNKSQVERILTNQGYTVGSRYLWKVEGDTMYTVMCYETENDVWTFRTVYPPEFEEGWGEDLDAMFDTFEVEEGYSVREHTQKAVMPEGEHPQLYEVTYADSTNGAWAVYEPEYTGSYIYNELTISNITDTTFDFTVTSRNYETDETEVVIPLSTAYFNDDMVSATYSGEDYTLTFDFTDTINPLPVVLSIDLWGVDSLEGISFYNNNIPGYEAG